MTLATYRQERRQSTSKIRVLCSLYLHKKVLFLPPLFSIGLEWASTLSAILLSTQRHKRTFGRKRENNGRTTVRPSVLEIILNNLQFFYFGRRMHGTFQHRNIPTCRSCRPCLICLCYDTQRKRWDRKINESMKVYLLPGCFNNASLCTLCLDLCYMYSPQNCASSPQQ